MHEKAKALSIKAAFLEGQKFLVLSLLPPLHYTTQAGKGVASGGDHG